MARRLQQLADLPVTVLKGVGAKAAESLEKAFGIETVLDLLTHYPRRYIDRTNEAHIADVREGQEAMLVVTVKRIQSIRPRGGRGRGRVTATVTDGTGHLTVTFFNQSWRERQLPPGTECILFGKVTEFRGSRQLTNPIVDLVGDKTGKYIPVYPQSEKERLTTWDVSRWMEEVLERAGTFADPVPSEVRVRYDLADRTRAFTHIHRPEAMEAMLAARKRLVFDELLRMQLALVLRKRLLEATAMGIRHPVGGAGGTPDVVAAFHDRLPFALTAAQKRTIGEIEQDLVGPLPMHRLLQGDVGSGKTLVAVSALLVAIQGGRQGALMAPTTVLAEQHFLGVSALLEGFEVPGDEAEGSLFAGQSVSRPLRVALLTNRTTAAERRKLAEELDDGRIDLLVGTHALIQDAVRFQALGVVVIDEQHRFGVEQRAALREKGADGATPDVLVMTATPIPRTAAMTVYGDLDVSILDELPPGRTPIDTVWVRTEGDGELTLGEDEVWEHVRAEVAAGHQAYVVCPLIDESEKLEARSAQETFDQLTAPEVGELAGLRVELLHGQLPAAEKEQIMDRFRRGELDVLVSTTVIEVGVDVPNATTMVILDADRFGIAQLHQLRGRVGRGAARSRCYLVAAGSTPDGEARLEALVRTTDGFDLAEVDLDLRGEGTILGERQKGRNDLKLASLRRDRQWVERAREVAFEIVDGDPGLAEHPDLLEEVALFLGDDEAEFLLKG